MREFREDSIHRYEYLWIKRTCDFLSILLCIFLSIQINGDSGIISDNTLLQLFSEKLCIYNILLAFAYYFFSNKLTIYFHFLVRLKIYTFNGNIPESGQLHDVKSSDSLIKAGNYVGIWYDHRKYFIVPWNLKICIGT